MKKIVLIVLMLLTTGTADADQLQVLTRAQAEAALGRLRPGSVFVEWISHIRTDSPVIYEVVEAEIVPFDGGPDVEIEVRVIRRGTGKLASGSDRMFDFAEISKPSEEKVVPDLAYTYVPLSEAMPGNIFINIALLMQLEANVRHPAIVVPEEFVPVVDDCCGPDAFDVTIEGLSPVSHEERQSEDGDNFLEMVYETESSSVEVDVVSFSDTERASSLVTRHLDELKDRNNREMVRGFGAEALELFRVDEKDSITWIARTDGNGKRARPYGLLWEDDGVLVRMLFKNISEKSASRFAKEFLHIVRASYFDE